MAKELAPHQERVLIEKADLEKNLSKLNAFINSAIAGEVGDPNDPLFNRELERLVRQSQAMQLYLNVLSERILNF